MLFSFLSPLRRSDNSCFFTVCGSDLYLKGAPAAADKMLADECFHKLLERLRVAVVPEFNLPRTTQPPC